ncbi:hypothetical protein JCM1841_003195 [Sporobolomyces salmonicolor]
MAQHCPDLAAPSVRISFLSDRLDRAKELLRRDCSSGNRFSLLALSMLEKNIEDLAAMMLLIEQTRSAGSSPSLQERPARLRITTEDEKQHGRRRADPPTSTPSSSIKAPRSREAWPPESDPSKAMNGDHASSPLPSRPSSVFKTSHFVSRLFKRKPDVASPPAASSSHEAARVRHGRSEEARRALDMASAPPSDDAELRSKPSVNLPPVLSGERVVKAIALAAADDKAQLLSLARVSKGYNKVVTPTLYSAVTVSCLPQLEKLNTSLDSNPSLDNFVSGLTITPLDASNPVSSASFLIPPLQRLVSRLPNLTALDEDFTATEWDVCTLSGKDYPLKASSPSRQLVRLHSAQCWWEITALHQHIVSQPQLQELVLGGAAMDRDWDGVKLKASLSGQLASEAPGRNLASLDIAQIMHEGTLAVLLLLASGGGSSSTPLQALRIGFQSIGASDDDTPRASVPAALELVGSTLTHLALSAPRKSGRDAPTGLLDECLAVLPALEVLEGSESTKVLPVPIGSGRTLSLLPKTLRVLRARGLVSVSMSKVLGLLDPPEGIPVLEELDVVWATGTGGEEGKESWWKERHVKRIEEACEEYGITCRVGKGDKRFVFRNVEV